MSLDFWIKTKTFTQIPTNITQLILKKNIDAITKKVKLKAYFNNKEKNLELVASENYEFHRKEKRGLQKVNCHRVETFTQDFQNVLTK